MARLSTYTKDVNLTGKDMLAGSNYVTTVNGIDQFETNNFTLKKVTEFINGQIVTDPSIISLKTNGGLVYETVSDTNYLAVDLSATNITGQLANSDLVNSSITINGTSVALGGSITIGEVSEVIAGTYLNGGGTEGTITLNHDNTTRTDTTSSISPAHESSFTAIDALSTNATGHVTAVNTKTITLPADTTYTIEAIDSSNDALIRLIGSDSSTDDIKLKAGANIVINVNESTDEIEIAGTAFGNVYTVNSEAAMIAVTSTAGDLVVRTDVSKTFIHNGGTTGTVADFTELQFSGIQQIDLVEGEGIALEDHASNPITTLTQNNNDLKVINTLATASERGGIQIGYTENGKNYPVELGPNPGDEKAYVNVPWTDTTYTAGSGLDLVGTEFSHTDTSSQASVNNSGRTYIQDITLDTFGHVTGLTSATETVADNYVDSITVTGSSTKTITIGRTGSLPDLTATFDDNDTVPTVNDGTLTVQGANGLTGSGTFTANDADSPTITISHADTSSQPSVNNSGRNYVQDIILDTYGHVTGIVSAQETYQYTHPTHPGDDIDLDTGPLSAGTVISDLDFNITTDTLGHVTDANASYQIYNLDNRYYTETEIGNFFSGTTGITGYNKSNWDTAYSWGNHATQGYITDGNTNWDNSYGFITASSTDTLTNKSGNISQWTNDSGYITDGNTNWDNIYGFITDGNTNWDNTYGFITASSTDTLTNKSGNISQWTNDSGYITGYTETSTLANVVSRGNTSNGTLRVNGSGAWLTAEGNVQSTNPPMGQGLAFGWNRSGGSRESEILFHGGTSTHSDGELYIRSWNGSSYVSVVEFQGTGNTNFSGNINAESTASSYIRKAYDSSRYAQLESNSSGGALNLTHTSSTRVLLRSYADCYFVNAGQVGFGTTTPTYPVHVTDQVSNTSIYASYDIVAYSDERVKEDIQVIPNALEKVSNIRGVTFKRKDADNENRMAGVIAQEIEKVLPEVVKEDKDGNKAVAYGNVVSLLIEAIKELETKVKNLENAITK
jgi:hypothetical protein